MKMNIKEKTILLLKIFIPIIIVIGLFLGSVNAGIITFKAPNRIVTGNITATIAIDFGDGKNYSKTITLDNSTVFGFLLELEKTGIIGVEKTYNEQMGSYEINSITYQGTTYVHGKDYSFWWLFYINGQFATEGADKIYVQNGDLIEWKYESF
jgi:hypothetical protein